MNELEELNSTYIDDSTPMSLDIKDFNPAAKAHITERKANFYVPRNQSPSDILLCQNITEKYKHDDEEIMKIPSTDSEERNTSSAIIQIDDNSYTVNFPGDSVESLLEGERHPFCPQLL